MADQPHLNREALALILLDRIAPAERDPTRLLNLMRDILATIDGQRPHGIADTPGAVSRAVAGTGLPPR